MISTKIFRTSSKKIIPCINLYRTFAAKNKKAVKVSQTPNEDIALFNLEKYTERMKKCVEKFRHDLSLLRLGRANPSILDTVKVNIDNDVQKMSNIARVVVKDNQTLSVIVYDRSHVSLVDKAIRATKGLNLNPVTANDTTVNVPIPKLTQEYRNQLVKEVSSGMTEAVKVKLRQHRQDARTDLKKHSAGVSKDEIKNEEREIQKYTDEYTKEAEELSKAKVKEIMSL